MRVTIIRDDNVVYVGGVARPVDCSALPSYFHALQWYGDAPTPYGEIEFNADEGQQRLPNTKFSDIAPYQFLIDAWEAAAPPTE